jgi:hypothetical protein
LTVEAVEEVPLPFVIVELTQYVPAGKNTVPPPAASAAARALLIAEVSSVEPLPVAPYVITL